MAKAAKKSAKKRVRSNPRGGAVCHLTPEPGPFTSPAGGSTFFILVTYQNAPEACRYTARSKVRWITATPRVSEFDVTVAPNPRKRAREGVVVVQGEGNSAKHQVTIRQSGR